MSKDIKESTWTHEIVIGGVTKKIHPTYSIGSTGADIIIDAPELHLDSTSDLKTVPVANQNTFTWNFANGAAVEIFVYGSFAGKLQKFKLGLECNREYMLREMKRLAELEKAGESEAEEVAPKKARKDAPKKAPKEAAPESCDEEDAPRKNR